MPVADRQSGCSAVGEGLIGRCIGSAVLAKTNPLCISSEHLSISGLMSNDDYPWAGAWWGLLSSLWHAGVCDVWGQPGHVAAVGGWGRKSAEERSREAMSDVAMA